MLVKIIKNGTESEWFELTKQQHRVLLKDMPDAAIVHIEDFYPDSPDRGTLVWLEFSVFNTLARDFILDDNRQTKRADRHHDKRPLEEINPRENQKMLVSVEDEYLHREQLDELIDAKQRLTEVQRRRLELYIEDGLSMREIATREGVHNTTIEESVRSALRKIKSFLN